MSAIENTSTIIKKDEPNEPEYKKLNNRVKYSFTITYILLISVATVTAIESLRTKVLYERHILNLITCVTLVSAYFYSIFLEKIANSEEKQINVDWIEISQNRLKEKNSNIDCLFSIKRGLIGDHVENKTEDLIF